jgi:hypothetical protein
MTGVPHGRRIGPHRAIPTGRSAMRSTCTVAAILLAAATVTSPASAMPADPPHKPARPLDSAAPASVVQTVASSDETSSGFDWSSAGIGAAGGVGAFAIALAATAGTRRRRLSDPAPSTPTNDGTRSRRSAPGPQPPNAIPISEVGTPPSTRTTR